MVCRELPRTRHRQSGETPKHAEAMIKEAVELWLECADEAEVRRRLQEREVAIKELELTHV